ncbi:unnamed protein product [Citrullus colocynthis]|uniref:Uncharacterized protein n=1 Tax=Citrullus colocynthis TaxID=252529 RepID=A0ABP0YYJ5_9ROSI
MELSFVRWSGGRGYVAAGVLRCRSPETRRERWRVVWRRVKKRIIMLYWSCRAGEMQVGYDRESYLKNFDDGCMMMMAAAMGEDADAISRSFSARFAISRPLP